MSSKRLTDEEKQRIVELYKNGLSMSKISIELGVHASTVKSNLIKAGVLKGDCGTKKTSKSSTKPKPKTKSAVKNKKSKFKTYTREEKVKYCNKKYGVGNWEFLDKETFIALMLDLQEYRSFTKVGV